MTTVTLNDREIAAVLTGLRLYQGTDIMGRSDGPALLDIATNGDAFDALDLDDVDALCERINCGGTP
jgi:hypothetical protein